MHRQRIIHRDIKPENILQNNGVFKIGDLGFSKQMEGGREEVKQTTLGSIPTMAPEVLARQPYGVKVRLPPLRQTSGPSGSSSTR
jgi:serine/threonine protein kinase